MGPKSATKRIQLWIPLVQCAWCRAVKLGDIYLHLPMLRLLSGEWQLVLPGMPPIVATLTHSICGNCASELTRRSAAGRAQRAASLHTPTELEVSSSDEKRNVTR